MKQLIKTTMVSVFALSAAIASSGFAQEATVTSDLSGFTRIELSTSADLKVIIADDYSITMTGDRDRIDRMELDVSGDELEISSKGRGFSFFGRHNDGYVNIAITMPNIEEMEINGSGDAELIGIDNEEILLNINGSGDLYVTGRSEAVEIEINGSGDIEMDEVSGKDVTIEINGSGNVEFDGGTCERMEIEVDGSGDIDAKDLICEIVQIEVEGSGNSRVHATELLVFESEGSGRVDVFGKPKEVEDRTKRDKKIRIR